MLLLLVLLSIHAGLSQTAGAPTTSAYDTHAVDSVNLQNLNVMLNVPIISKSGAMPLSLSLTASSGCVVNGSGTNRSTECGLLAKVNNPQVFEYVWEGFVPSVRNFLNANANTPVIGFNTTTTVNCPSLNTFTEEYSGWWIQTNDQTQHILPPNDMVDSLGCFSSSLSDQAIDGSGYTLVITGSTQGNNLCNPNVGTGSTCTIYEAGGTAINVVPQVSAQLYFSTQAVDSNSNAITFSAANNKYTDTLDLTAVTEDNSTSPSVFSWTDVNGHTQRTTINYSAANLQAPAFCGSGAANSNASVPTSISFPTGGGLGVAYEPTSGTPGSVTGRLGTLTLRTGGTITYTYPGTFNCSYLAPSEIIRTTSDGTTTYTWAAVNNGGGNWGNTTTVVDNGGNSTVYTFTGLTSAGNAAPPVTQALTEIQRSQGSGTLLTTDLYCYNAASGQPGNCSTAVVSLPIKEVDVYHTINGMSNSSRRQVTYDKYGNVLVSAQYDFGATTPTVQTTAVYGSWNGSTCVAVSNTVNNKPCTITTVQSGSTIAQSRFSYDSHGNLLITYKWNGSTFLSNSTSNVYNSNGTIATSYDLANNLTSIAYNGTDGCNSLFPTSVTKGGLTTKSTWNCTGGVKLTDTDANGNVTNYGYTDCVSGVADPFWRVMSVTDPLGNKACKTNPSASSPDTVNSSFTFNSGNSIQNTTTTMDGYGRTINVQGQQGPTATNYDTGSTTYGWSGNYRQVQATLPCSQTLGSLCSFNSPQPTTSLFDPLGRPHTLTDGGGGVVTKTYTQNDVLTVLSPAPANENNKKTQKEYDGLGRLKSSCRIMVSGGYSSCSQATGSYSGVFTTYSYRAATGSTTTTATRGSQTRTATLDALGRATQKTTPETGTWKSYYDSSTTPACPSGYTGASGLLEATVDPNGNLLCYKYDSLNRVTGINANGTTCRLFFYDNSKGLSGSIPSGVTTPTNSSGRMVEAATTNCSTTLFTDLWLSYDKDGRVLDQWELTPNSGQYYHSTATFYGNGAVNTLQLASPSLYTMTYGLDGEGRWNSLNSGSQKYVTGATFNAASQPTQIVLTGSGPDQDDYVYDSNTGRMTKFTFQVGNTPATMVGQLNWNSNGTLNNLVITDGFNSGGTQTCYFDPLSGSGMGYDDLGRLVNDDCGSGGWGQTFSYDQFNNLTKAVISGRTGVTFNPGYNSANNRYASGFGATYDTNGNLTNDTFHTYTWNEFSRVKSVDMNGTGCATGGECIVYDALGRAVEIDKGSTHTEIWYTQVGKTVFMNGAASINAYWPTPAGGTENLVGNCPSNCSSYYMHKDWLGSARIVSGTNNHEDISDMAFAPYGEIYAQFGVKGPGDQMFTGDTQDVVGGTMETPNREYNSSAQGRWISPDPAGAGWNLYAYATNPNNSVDPSGLAPKYEPAGCSPLVGCIGPQPISDGGPFAGISGSALDVLAMFGTLNIWINSVGSNGGTVGSDSGSSSSTGSSANSSGGSSSDGPPLDPFNLPAGSFATQPDVLTAILDTSNEPLPQLVLDGQQGPVNAVAGCGGPGIPCHVTQQDLGPWFGLAPSLASGERYFYTVEDSGGNVVNNITVTEWYRDFDSPGSSWTDESTWSLARGNCTTCPSGSFTDTLVGEYATPGYNYLQMLTVQAGAFGPNYLLTTQIHQQLSPGPNSAGNATIIVP